MSQAPIKKFDVNKQELKTSMLMPIIMGGLSVFALILYIVCSSKANEVKNSIDYMFRPDFYREVVDAYTGWATLTIIMFVLAIVITLATLISFIMLRKAYICIYEDHIEGNAGRHWNGWCLGTKNVTIDYEQIVSAEPHHIKQFQNKYVVVKTKDDRKYTFAVNDVEEVIGLIKSHVKDMA